MADSSDEDLPTLVVDAHSSGSDEEDDEGGRPPVPALARSRPQPFQRTGQIAAPNAGPYSTAPLGVGGQGAAQQPIPGLGGQAAADGPGMVAFQMPLLMQMPGAQGTVQVHLGFGPPPLGLGPMNGAPGPPMWQRPEEQEEEPLFMSRAERLHREQREQHRVPFMMPMMGNAAPDGSGDGGGLMGLQMPFVTGGQQGAEAASAQQQAQPLMPFLNMLSSMMGTGTQPPPDSSAQPNSRMQHAASSASAGMQPASSGRGRGIAMPGTARRTVRVARRPRASTPPPATQPVVQQEQLPVPPRFQLLAPQQGLDAPAESPPSQQQPETDMAAPSTTTLTSMHEMLAAATSGVRSFDPFSGGVCLSDSDDEEAHAALGSPQQQQEQQQEQQKQQEEDRFLAQRRRQREQQYERFDRQQVELPAFLQASQQPAAQASTQAPNSAAGQALGRSGSANELPGSDSDGPIIFTFTSSNDSDSDAAGSNSGSGTQLQRLAQPNAQQGHAQRAVKAADGGDDDSVPELHSDTDTDTEDNSDSPEPAAQQSQHPGQHSDHPHDEIENDSDSVPDLDSGSSSDGDSSPRTPLHREQQQEEQQQQVEGAAARPLPATRPAGLPGPVLPVRTRAGNARSNAPAGGGAAASRPASNAASGSLAAPPHGQAAGGTIAPARSPSLTPRLSDAASSADSLPPLENSSSCNSEDSDSLDGWDAGYGEPCPALLAASVSSDGLDESDSKASWETASDDDVVAAAAPGQQQQQQQRAASSRPRRDAFFVPPGAQGTQLLTPEATEQLQRQVQQQLGLMGEQQQPQARHMAPHPHLRHLFMNEEGAGAPAAADGAAAAVASPFNLRFGRSSGNSRSSAAPKPASARKQAVPAPIKQLLQDKEVLGQLLTGLDGVDAGSECIKSALAHLVAS